MVCQWLDSRSCTHCELEPLTGHLAHAATVICPGCILRPLCSDCNHCQTPSLCSPQSVGASQFALVAPPPAILEWLVILSSFSTLGARILGCFWFIWLWCIWPASWLVPIAVATNLVISKHSHQRVCPWSDLGMVFCLSIFCNMLHIRHCMPQGLC